MSYVAFFDGSCEPCNPGGTVGYGAIILKDNKKIWQHSASLPASPENSCNVAEYLGLITVLDWFIKNNLTHEQILIRGDSKLVIEQCFGKWRIKKGLYFPFAVEAKLKLKQFSKLQGSWISRDYNTEADALSKAGS